MKKRVYEQKIVEPLNFDKMVSKLRGFFMQNGYLETYPQPRLSIMAACEDPKTVRNFVFGGQDWPLSQTNQMWLEFDLLKFNNNGVYCLTTSYRDEPNPIEGRHDKIFPMFEFEHKGEYNDLLKTLSELSVHMGFVKSVKDIPFLEYDELCKKYGVEILEAEHETKMWQEYGDVVAITHFPERTSPFWNMKQEGENRVTKEKFYNKCDFIICGIETFGSAERESNVEQMRNSFHTISDGMYAKLLFNEFSEERVVEELEDYLSLPMFKRYGGGIGLTRLLRAMKIKGLV
jgi:aspartyl/asparaginyl-tRNA synthetase